MCRCAARQASSWRRQRTQRGGGEEGPAPATVQDPNIPEEVQGAKGEELEDPRGKKGDEEEEEEGDDDKGEESEEGEEGEGKKEEGAEDVEGTEGDEQKEERMLHRARTRRRKKKRRRKRKKKMPGAFICTWARTRSRASSTKWRTCWPSRSSAARPSR